MVMLDCSDYQVQYTAAYRLLKFDPHGLADELLEIYGLTLDCLAAISTCLAGKPYSVLLQRGRFVCFLESCGHYARAEAEAAATLDALRCALSPAASAKPCRGAASVAPLLPKGRVKEGACVVLLQLATRIAVSNLHKNTKKSFSETIKDMYLHYNERSGLLSPLIDEDIYEVIMKYIAYV